MILRRWPLWLWVWLSWFALGLSFAWRSFQATDLTPPSRHPRAECSPSLSGNGRILAFEEADDKSGFSHLCVVDLLTQKQLRLGQDRNESSHQPTLDETGETVAFASSADDWSEGDNNSVSDVFVYDLKSSQCQRILPPQPLAGLSSSYRPQISRDGQKLAFLSYGLKDSGSLRGRNVCLWTRSTDFVRQLPDIHRGRGPVLGAASFSPSGDRLAFSQFSYDMVPNPGAIHYDIYLMPLHPRAPWPPSEPPLPDRLATGLGVVNQWIWDSPDLRRHWPLARLSHQSDGGPANANSYQPVLLEDECLFTSLADNLVADDRNDCHDIFVRPLGPGPIRRLHPEGNDSSFEPAASKDGRFVAFTSYASNLVKGDDNATSDVFLLDRQQGRLIRLSQDRAGPSHSPTISSDGQRVAFVAANKVWLWARGQALRSFP